MSQCVITTWEFVPEDPPDEPCFQTYILTGKHTDGDFSVKVSFEIDGRDAEYEQKSGIDMRWDSDDEAARNRWDDLMLAIEGSESLKADMEKRSEAYYA
jgi:hypothetical protein